jgi:glutamine amidotransferase
MLVGAGRLPVKKLLDDFKLMAQNKNEKHELNKNNPNFIHGDGWGIVIGKSGKLESYKKSIACWKDPKFNECYNTDADFIMLHARRASQGMPVTYEFTHPFEKDCLYFCHNGTIYDFEGIEEKSDSKQLFKMILNNLKHYSDVIDAIRKTVNNFEIFSALNFILANDNKAYVLDMYGKNKYGREFPKYYTMKYLVKENYAVISSERLPSFDSEWRKIENKTILVLNRHTHHVKRHSVF